jgi:hypothetical protein
MPGNSLEYKQQDVQSKSAANHTALNGSGKPAVSVLQKKDNEDVVTERPYPQKGVSQLVNGTETKAKESTQAGKIEEHKKQGIAFTRKILDIQMEMTLMLKSGSYQRYQSLLLDGYSSEDAKAVLRQITDKSEGWFRSVAPIFEGESRLGAYQGGLNNPENRPGSVPAAHAAGLIVNPQNDGVHFGDYNPALGDGGTSRRTPKEISAGKSFPGLPRNYEIPKTFEVSATYLEAKAKYEPWDVIAVFIDANLSDGSYQIAYKNALQLQSKLQSCFNITVPIRTLAVPKVG